MLTSLLLMAQFNNNFNVKANVNGEYGEAKPAC